jgi:hypothetical protein
MERSSLRVLIKEINVSQFQKLDESIVTRIAGKGVQFTPLFSANDVREESQRLAIALGREPFRVLDGRLQALKRKGLISYGSKTGWVKNEPVHPAVTN